MFHADTRGTQKDTDAIPSIGEGQPMQPMDDQPLRQSLNEQSSGEKSDQEERTLRNAQHSQVEKAEEQPAKGQTYASEGQSNTYRGVSEQIPLSYPSTSAPAQPGATPLPEPPGQGWTYPPRPEQYQQRVFGPPVPQAGASSTRLFGVPGQFNQPAAPSNTPFGQSYSTPTAPFHFSSTAQPGMGMVPPPRRQGSGLRTGSIIALVVLLAAVFATGLFAGWQFGRSGGVSSLPPGSSLQPGNNPTVTVPQLTNNNAEAVREAVISKVQPAIVQIDVTTASQHALGSGVIIDARGYVVTNNHVVANASSIRVTLSDNRSFPAQVAGTDAADDLAVVKFTPPSSGLTTVTFGDSSQLRVGQDVLAIGSPLGNSETVTQGIISALNRNVSEGQGGATLPDAIQTDAPINPGNSGGALVDMQGNLVGMPTLNAIDTEFNTPANGLGFAIPSNRIKFIAEQIISTGHVSHTGRAILGVTVTDVDPNTAAQNHLSVSSGTLIVNVSAGGPAASAGLKAGDVIVQVENTTVNSTSDLSKALLRHKPGDTVAVKVSRGNQQLTINVTLGELPAS
jgi:S1-C subfamily serine protease